MEFTVSFCIINLQFSSHGRPDIFGNDCTLEVAHKTPPALGSRFSRLGFDGLSVQSDVRASFNQADSR